MNEAQRRHLMASMRRIDELLAEADLRLAPAAEDRLFPPWRADAAPVQRQCNADYSRRLRSAMRGSLERLGVAVPAPDVSGVWSARTLLMTARVAVADLEPKILAGYGTVVDEDARELRTAAAECSGWLDQMEAYLAQGPGDALAARLRRIGIHGANADALAELERVVATHGLIGFRPALAQLAERLAAPGLEVAVFGRVKAGKSSLLNRLLDTSVLPVGVTPVTEIPVRLVYGEPPLGHVEFMDASPQDFDLARLGEFVSAQENPGNARHVTRLAVRLPAPLLRDGIAFVDTPGLGSVVGVVEDPAGAEALAYLPRCDLGLVLVDAAATLTDADVQLVDALHHTGAGAQVLLAKADLLTGQDLEQSLDFIRRRLAERLGATVPVHPVSARPEASALTEHWLESVLRPRLADGQRLAAEALARKCALLRDAVRATLARRLATTTGGAPALASARRRQAAQVLGEALSRLDQARRTPPEEVLALASLASAALDQAAHNAALIWHESHTRELDATPLVESMAQARAGVAASAAARQLGELRALAQAALSEAAGAVAADLPRASGLPVLDASGALPPIVAHRPPLLALAGATALRRTLREQMRAAGLDHRLADVFRAHSRRLQTWREAALGELRQSFLVQRELLMGEDLGRPDDPETEAGSAAGIAADLRRLDEIGVGVEKES